MATDTVLSPGRELTITRVLNAPIELVWNVWTDPDHIKNWWGPNGFTNTIFEMDVKPGGNWEFIMHGPDGKDRTVKTFKADIGLKQNIFKLEGYLRSVSPEKEMKLIRMINAPRELVFRAWTDPAEVKKWWGPKDFTNPVCNVDATPG